MENKRMLLAREYAALDEQKKSLKAQESEIESKMKEVGFALLQEMESEGLDRFKDSELGKTFFPVTDLSIKELDNEAFFGWLQETGQGDVIKMTVNANTRKAIVKDYMKETGRDVPGIEATPYTKVGMRAS